MERMTAAELMAADVGVRQFAVQGMVPRGSVTLLSAKKGRNKSVFGMCMGDAVSRGGLFLGRQTKRGQVLYIGSEDDQIELFGRYSRLVESSGEEPSQELDLVDRWPKQREGGIDKVAQWCDAAEEPMMVIVDIIGKMEPRLLSVRGGWGAILELLEPWIELARDKSIAVVLVTHNYRGPDFSENPIEKMQGSGGLAAYAQTVLVIEGKNGETDRLLTYQGKFGSGSLALSIDGGAMTCTLRDAQALAPEEAPGSPVRDLLARLVRAFPGLKARALARKLPGRTVGSTERMLQMMADVGELTVLDRRYYMPGSEEEAEQLMLAGDLRLVAS
jgi:hypothetical protein